MKKGMQLALILLEGEGERVEFKERLAQVDREMVAFANAGGGSIFVGVDDLGQIKPLKITNALKSQIQDLARNCDPPIKIKLQSYPHEGIIEIQVPEGIDKPYRCKDGFFIRTGPSAQKLNRDEIVYFINQPGKIRFDEAVNEQFNYPTDFSEPAFAEYLNLCGIRSRLKREDILISLNVAKENHSKIEFTNAGVLFFGLNPQKLIPESFITCARYGSNDRFSILDKKDFKGNLISQIEEALEFLKRHISTAMEFNQTQRLGQRREISDYPLVALREAIVNAVAHRDYFYDSSRIYIHLYRDHIDIENPGGLFHGLTLEKLGTRSIRRNRLIADLLQRAGFVEQVGTGFDRMRIALEQNNNPPLEVNALNFFSIRFYKRITHDDLSALTPRQQKILHFMQEQSTVTKKWIAQALETSEDTAIRELNQLIKLKFIKKQGTGKQTQYVLIN